MTKPTRSPQHLAARSTLWSAKDAPRRTCSCSAGVSWSFGRPRKCSLLLRGRGPGGPNRAREKVSHGVPAKTTS
eukprot:14999641-Alexandrium_andersonii.AAC.1